MRELFIPEIWVPYLGSLPNLYSLRGKIKQMYTGSFLKVLALKQTGVSFGA